MYWSLNLRQVYDKDGILLPSEDAKVMFKTYRIPKIVTDDPVLLPTVARILDAMLRKLDPAHPNLVHYFTTINLDVQIQVLLPKGEEGTSKVVNVSKKLKIPEQPKSVTIQADNHITNFMNNKSSLK